MSYSLIQRRIDAAITRASSSDRDTTVSVDAVVPFDSFTDLVGSASSTYSISSGVITLPNGYWYLIKGTLQARFTTGIFSGYIKYIWKNHSDNSDLGRRGTLIMQEEPQTFGGDEIAFALIDATSSDVNVKLTIQSINNVVSINNDTEQRVASWNRAEIWKFKG